LAALEAVRGGPQPYGGAAGLVILGQQETRTQRKQVVTGVIRLADSRLTGTNWRRGAGPRSVGAEIQRILAGAALRAAGPG
jgi:hypothetical protein